MENLIKYTSRLVARNNCVIIPGMGAFLAHNVPASYNAEERVFMPPHRTLGFNSRIIADDALLLSEYLDEQQASYEEVGKIMRSDIESLRHLLSLNGTVRFGELGTFSMNVKGEISFEPAPNGIDDPYNFGFEPIVIPQLKEIEKKDIVIKRQTFKKYVSMAAAIILTFFFISPVGDRAYKPSMQASIIATDTKNSVELPVVTPAEECNAAADCRIEPVIDTVTENIITVETAKEPVTVEEAPMPTIIEEQPSVTYSIIVASTPNEEKASLAIKELSSKLEADYSVVKGNGRHRIAYGSYSSNADATAALATVKAIFPDAWVLTH